jgi:hypothetical protein
MENKFELNTVSGKLRKCDWLPNSVFNIDLKISIAIRRNYLVENYWGLVIRARIADGFYSNNPNIRLYPNPKFRLAVEGGSNKSIYNF